MINSMSSRSTLRRRVLFVFSALAAIVPAHGQLLSEKDLIAQLRIGGYVIVMRHANSPPAAPDSAHADADNIQHERQLDDTGRASARAMGDALRRLQIPIGQVLSSPTYRALETVRVARLGQPKSYPQLDDLGESMQPDPNAVRAAWLRLKAAEAPLAGTNTIIVTHVPNMLEAFAQSAAGLASGEGLIFRPDGHGAASIVGRVKIEEWPRFLAAH